MSRRCATLRRAAAMAPRVTDALSALDAVEAALPDDFDDGVVVLPLNRAGRARLAFAFRGGWPHDLDPLVDVLLEGAATRDVASVVVALVHPGDDWDEPDALDDLEPWRPALRRLADGGVTTTAFLVLGVDTWASVRFDGPG